MFKPHVIIIHAALWLGVLFFWLVATRQYHPTLAIAVSATTVLVLASALAVYINSLFLLPKFARRHLWWRYAATLAAAIIVLDLIAVPAIQSIYDLLWHPDPLRFGFWFNLMSDGFIIALHVAIATGLVWAIRSRRAKTLSPSIKG